MLPYRMFVRGCRSVGTVLMRGNVNIGFGSRICNSNVPGSKPGKMIKVHRFLSQPPNKHKFYIRTSRSTSHYHRLFRPMKNNVDTD